MKTSDRYDTTGLDENEFEPGSGGTVLKNLRGIVTVTAMEQAETVALLDTTEAMFDRFDQDHCFLAADLCDMHREWLGVNRH